MGTGNSVVKRPEGVVGALQRDGELGMGDI